MTRVLNILLICSAFCITWSAAGDEETIDEAIAASQGSSTDAQKHQKDNAILTEYDMLFTPEQYKAIEDMRSGKRLKRNALRNLQSRWTNAVVPYNLEGGFSSRDLQNIRSGINEWNKFSCVNIRPTTGSDQYYVTVTPNGGGCSSYVGMTRRSGQKLTLARGCRYKGIVAHEFGHALGFHHEQTRPDRDQHVRILKQNINSRMLFNFNKYDWNKINAYDVPYDYESVMHYGKTAFSTNGQMTIQTVDPKYQNVIGNRYGISFFDIKLINLMYSCNQKCPKKNCRGSGFVGKDCKCWCKGPSIKQPAVYCDTNQAVGGGNSVGPTPTKPPTSGLTDNHPNCPHWARRGECQKNPRYMLINCKKSCSA